jgi:outer membrane protein TolC
MLLLPALPVHAQSPSTPAASATPGQPRQLSAVIERPGIEMPAPEVPPVEDNAIVLSLDQAIEIAIQNNLDVVIERYNRSQTRLGILDALGIYDLQAQAGLLYVDRSQATTSQLQASNFKQRQANFQLLQPLPNGGSIAVGVEAGRSETDVRFDQPSSYSSDVTFSFSQPLLRGFGSTNFENSLILARTDSAISLQQFETQVTTTLQQVSEAYWDLVEAYEQLDVAEQSLNLAKDLHERNKIQVDVGTKPPLDLVQSEAAIAEREEGIIRAQAAIGNSEDTLRRLLNFPDGQYWNLPIKTTTAPETERLTINLDESIKTALEQRPELRLQNLNVERARIQSAFLRNQAKPQLDLNIDYGLSGAGSSLGNTLDQITGIDFDGWTARLNFSYPLQNRSGRARSTIADLVEEQAEVTLDRAEAIIVTEVRQAARRVETAAKQIEAARASRQFQEKNLEAERKRYENGMSTSFQITQIQDDLTQAQSREVSAVIEYRRALTEYYRATGRLLDQEDIELLDPAQPEKRFQFSLFR